MHVHHRSIIICAGIISLLTAVAVFPATYLVGPERGITRLQNVTAKLAPGDTVFVDGNATYQGDVRFTKAGTASNKIVVKGVRIDDKRPVISGGTNTVHFNNSHHLVFEGFDVTGGSSRGIFHQADSVIVRDVVVHDCPQQGILGADIGSGTLTLEYSEVHHCGSGAGRHQIYMTTDQVNFPGRVFRMQFCYVHDANGGNNVKSRSERNEIYNNWIEGAYYHELELIGPDPGGVDNGWTIGLKREDSDVVGNVLYKRPTSADNDPDFAVTRLGGDATGWTHGRYRFVNNTIVAGSGAVFRLFDTLESVEMHNNIFYRSGGGVNMYRAAEGEMAWSSGNAVFAGMNNWVVSKSANIPAAWSGTKTGADPGFVNFAGNDLRIDKDSPCRDGGIAECNGPEGYSFTNPLPAPRFLPPQADALPVDGAQQRAVDETVDIGAFEYLSNAVTVRPDRPENGNGLHVRSGAGAGGAAVVSFTLSSPSTVELRIHKVSGQLIHRESWGEMSRGAHVRTIRCGNGDFSAAGTYVLELRTHGSGMWVPYINHR